MISTGRNSHSSFDSENPSPSLPSQNSVDCSNGSFPEENGGRNHRDPVNASCVYFPKFNVFYFHRPRLLDFISSLAEALVESASKRAFASLPDLSKAVPELTVLKGVGPATASAVLAAYAPEVAPFMSDEVSLDMVFWQANAKDDSFACFEGYTGDNGQC